MEYVDECEHRKHCGPYGFKVLGAAVLDNGYRYFNLLQMFFFGLLTSNNLTMTIQEG